MTWTAEAQRLQSEVQNTDAEIQAQQDRLQQEELTAQQRKDIQNDLNRLSTLRSQLQDQYVFFAGRDARILQRTQDREEQAAELKQLRAEAAAAGSGSPEDIAYLKEREAQGKAFESYTPIAYTGTYSKEEARQVATYTEGGKTVTLYDLPANGTTYNPGFLSQVGVTPTEPRPDLIEAQNKVNAEQFKQDIKNYSQQIAEQHKESIFAKQQASTPPKNISEISPNEIRAAAKPKGIIEKVVDYHDRLQFEARYRTDSPLERQSKMFLATAISVPVGLYQRGSDFINLFTGKTEKAIIYTATHPFEAGAQLKEQIDMDPAGFIGENIGYMAGAKLLTAGASRLKSKVFKVEVSGSQLETRRITNPETGKVIDIAQQDTQVIVGKNKYSFTGVAAEVYSPTTKENLFTSKGRLELVQTEGGQTITKGKTIGLISVTEKVASAERLTDLTINTGKKTISKQLLSASKQVLEGKKTSDVSMVLKAEKNKPLSTATPESISVGKTFEILDTQTPSGLRYQIFEGASLGTTEKSFLEAISNKEIPEMRKVALNRVIESGGSTGTTKSIQKLKSATQIQDFKQLTETVTRENIQATTFAKLKPIAENSILLKTGLVVEPIMDFKARTAPAVVVKTNLKTEPLLEPPVQTVKQSQKISRRIETKIVSTPVSKQSTAVRTKSDVISQSKVSEITMQETGINNIAIQKEIQATAQESVIKQKVLSGLKVRTVSSSQIITQTPFQMMSGPAARPFVHEQERGGIFSLFIRRRGRFMQEGTMPSITEAFETGISKVQHSAAASFKIEGANPEEISQAAFSILPQSFGRSKREAGVFIQKRGFRIGTQEEKAEITFKGIQASRSKKKKRIFGKISLGG